MVWSSAVRIEFAKQPLRASTPKIKKNDQNRKMLGEGRKKGRKNKGGGQSLILCFCQQTTNNNNQQQRQQNQKQLTKVGFVWNFSYRDKKEERRRINNNTFTRFKTLAFFFCSCPLTHACIHHTYLKSKQFLWSLSNVVFFLNSFWRGYLLILLFFLVLVLFFLFLFIFLFMFMFINIFFPSWKSL